MACHEARGRLKACREAAEKANISLEPDDLWVRVRAGFAINDLTGPLVKQKTKQYAARPE